LLSELSQYDLTDEGIMIVNQDTKKYYQYVDYTAMTEYLFECIDEVINNYIEREIQFLIHYDSVKKSIQSIVDMPDNQIDLFIKFVIQNNGVLSSNKRNRIFPLLNDQEIEQITAIINEYDWNKS
jgi:hypothetical protein